MWVVWFHCVLIFVVKSQLLYIYICLEGLVLQQTMKEFDKHPCYFAQAKKNHGFLIKMVAAGVEKLRKEFIEKKMKPEDIKKMLVDQAKTAKDVSQSTIFLRSLGVEDGAKKPKTK